MAIRFIPNFILIICVLIYCSSDLNGQVISDEVRGIQRAAEEGDISAVLALGVRYFQGNGIPKDKEEGFNCFKRAANGGSKEAMSVLGDLYFHGEGVQKDTAKSVYWWHKAAEKGETNAMYKLSVAYHEGIGIQNNPGKAFDWLLKAANGGNPEAMYNLGATYNVGDGVQKNPEEAFKWLLKAANVGNTEAMSFVGWAYTHGYGIQKNLEEAFKWLLKAANAGNSEAMFNIALLYNQGNWVKKDPEEAFKWFLKAANAGRTDAMVNVGWAYMYGEGVQKNTEQALNWFKQAADNGNSYAIAGLYFIYQGFGGLKEDDEAAFKWASDLVYINDSIGLILLGNCYANGIGVSKNLQDAFHLFQQAMEKGCIISYSLLSQAYAEGRGTNKNLDEAFRLAKIGAQKEDLESIYLLANYYIRGIGTTVNLNEAEKWANKLVEIGYIKAYGLLGKIYGFGARKDTELALKYVNEGLSKYHENPTIFRTEYLLNLYNIKGKIYLEDSQIDKALEMAREIARVNPNYDDEEDNLLMSFYYGDANGNSLFARNKDRNIESDVDTDIPINNFINANTFAVIIGNENYEDVAKVEFAKRDANSFAEYCQKVLGLPANNVRKYNDATYGKMISALEDIQAIAKAHAGDINIIFYYAGHGVPNEKDFSSYLLPVDGSGRSTSLCLPLNELYETLSDTKSKRILVFLDACFSGANRGEGMLASARGVAIKTQSQDPRNNMVVFSASSEDETAFPYKEQGHGMFTYYLLKKLKESKGNVTLADLADYIKSNVTKQSVIINRKSQTPTTRSSVDLKENWFIK